MAEWFKHASDDGSNSSTAAATACGMTVLISDYFEYYRLAAYLVLRTKERIGIVMGVPSLYQLFDSSLAVQPAINSAPKTAPDLHASGRRLITSAHETGHCDLSCALCVGATR